MFSYMGLTLKKRMAYIDLLMEWGGGGGGGQDVHPLNALVIKWDREQQDLT